MNGTPADSAPPPRAESLDHLLPRLQHHLALRRRRPVSTYRLQFHAGFTFQDAIRIIPYLHRLGITECYASPFLKARSGSMHGYDISDHRSLNPEIGSDADCAELARTLHALGMGLIIDIVPNHMGVIGNENAWWNDILENGPSARHAGYFDIDWQPLRDELHGKVMLCILGEPYGKALESGHITLRYDAGCFGVQYFDHRFPVSPKTALHCLRFRIEELEEKLGKEAPELMEYHSILTALAHLPGRFETEPAKVEERYREKEVVKRRLAALTESSAAIRVFVQENVTQFNGKKGDRHSFDQLDQMLNDQVYRLAYWQVAADEINYRRFFDVNELAALSMEKPEVFARTHELILRLIADGVVTGLRIDHPDGLFDPRQYFETLQHHALVAMLRGSLNADAAAHSFGARLGENGQAETIDLKSPAVQEALRQWQALPSGPLARPFYVLAEKILGRDERIPEDWPVHGTTGYEFLNQVNGLFVAQANEAAFSRIYQRWSGMAPMFRPYVRDKKFLILQVALAGELHVLGHQLDRLSEKHRWSRDFTRNSLRHALREIIACFPVYRSYITDTVLERDRRYVEMAVAHAKRRNPALSSSIFDFVRNMLLLRYPDSATETDQAEQRRFVGKFQQVTSPVMAKGMEDTAFYVHTRLVSLNEVGGDPGRFGLAPSEVHKLLQERRKDWPSAMSASSTHDTKRSEDVRARLNVLSELPGEWQKSLARWNRLNKRHRKQVEGADAPDRNDEYLLYQTLLGAWLLPGEDHGTFVERIRAYMTKAIHEAKVHSSWTNPNSAYDEAMREFVARILDEHTSRQFLEHFRKFQARISYFGLFNSLAQTLVKITAPGVPDFYQGTELWDFSLVDPDNRRPVDYGRRESMLNELIARVDGAAERLPSLARELVEAKEDGRIKLYLLWQALRYRVAHESLFTEGEYVPLGTLGAKADNVFAFARRSANECAIVVIPRLITQVIAGPPDLPLGRDAWHDTVVLFPDPWPTMQYRNLFTGEICDGQPATGLPLAQAFANFPVALLSGVSP